MDIREELDKIAHTHGYELRDDDPPCSDCIHQPMCSGRNCHFDRKWWPEELEKKYYRVNEFDRRMDDELFSLRDIAEFTDNWEYDKDDLHWAEVHDWNRAHPYKEHRTRLSIIVDVDARDEMEARKKACKEYCVDEDDPFVECDVLYKYRMPVKYLCCEEGISWRYEYTYAKNAMDAKYRFVSEWVPDIESCPSFDDIEKYDPETGDWNGVNTRGYGE